MSPRMTRGASIRNAPTGSAKKAPNGNPPQLHVIKVDSTTSAQNASSKAHRSTNEANMARKRKRTDEVEVEGEADKHRDAKPHKTPRTQAKPSNGNARPQADLDAGAKQAHSIIPKAIVIEEDGSPSKKRDKANTYGLSPGESPFPAYARPTPEECRQVVQLLSDVHGHVSAPKQIPTPSLTSSGCGEVPSVLDALVRTRLSAATNNSNSSRAFRGLVETFGTIQEGTGKGSVDWDKVRTAPLKDIFEAIKTGGLADVKSRDIQKILQMVHKENQTESGGKVAVLSLDHLHNKTNDEAFQKLLEYPGIGPKTASCVLLFCMQRPSFAVDTHVFRLTSALGWVPTDSQAKAMYKRGEAKTGSVTRNSTYAHLDIRIPDELKYPLHYLLIRHGKNCPKCNAKKDRAVTEAWGDKPCPLKRVGLIKVKLGKAKVEISDPGVKEEDVSHEKDLEAGNDA